jgi:hypothetical protein
MREGRQQQQWGRGRGNGGIWGGWVSLLMCVYIRVYISISVRKFIRAYRHFHRQKPPPINHERPQTNTPSKNTTENEWGSYCYLMGDLRGAEEAFARALELDPGRVLFRVEFISYFGLCHCFTRWHDQPPTNHHQTAHTHTHTYTKQDTSTASSSWGRC